MTAARLIAMAGIALTAGCSGAAAPVSAAAATEPTRPSPPTATDGAATDGAATDGPATDRANPRLTLGHAEVWLEPEGRDPVRVSVEVAHTEPLRRRGLMYRRHLARDAGMLFVFPRAERQSFWMRNTFLRLDMIFVDDGRVVGIVEDAAPLTEEERAVEQESKYVLEVHAGFAREHGLALGTPVRFANVVEE